MSTMARLNGDQRAYSALHWALNEQVVALSDVEIRLRDLHQFCDGCDCSRARCESYVADGCIACCPDCIHRWARS